MRGTVLFLLAIFSASAAESDFNGRWDIRVPAEPRHRAWWLEVEGAGTPAIKGRFVGFPGGDTKVIQKISVQSGELRFSFDNDKQHQIYRAKLTGGKLQGSFDDGRQHLMWTGVRAPEIKDKDDSAWKEGKPVALFNGKDLSGWHATISGKELGWSVKNGLLSSTGGANNIETYGKFWNFKLHVEYRVGEHSNSGVGLRGRYEVQILEDFGKPADIHGNGSLYSRIVPAVNASKKAGEWQTFDIRLVGRQVTVVLNGKKLMEKAEIEGLTAMATNPDEAEPGPISLQGDHGPVDFRSIVLIPMVK